MKPIPLKNIILCADDYGLNASVSQGIINLLQRKRLSAVSCLTTSSCWPEQAVWLTPFQGPVGLGLHFNLTEGKALSPAFIRKYGESLFPLSRLIIQAFLRQLDGAVLEQECQAQLDCFVAAAGFYPDFIDGHQHIQQLPQVRDALLRVYERSLRSKKAYLRSVSNAVSSPDFSSKIKQSIIYFCGSPGFQRLLKKHAIPHNAGFAGIYAFPQAAAYSRILPHFLKNIQDKGLIMCHPGLISTSDPQDLIAAARFQEYSYLASEQFTADCQSLGVRLIQFPA